MLIPAGLRPQDVPDTGVGSFFGPFASGTQALAVLAGYPAAFVLVAAVVLRRRDVA